MFRKMRRFRQQLSEDECREVLKSGVRGVLSVNGDDGYPYGLPVDYWFDEKNNRICFHGAKAGHKIDSVEKNDKVSFCVMETGAKKEGDWAFTVRSVILFGRIRKVTDPEQIDAILRGLCARFPAPEGYADYEIAKSGRSVQCLEIIPEHMTGKRVHEA